MRDSLRLQLAGMTDELGSMALAATTAMRDATTALLDLRVRLAEQVITADAHLDARRDEIEERAVEMLALQQPVATDLRRIVAVIHVADDIERMGDLAAHVARTARRRSPGAVVPADVGPLFRRIGDTAMTLALKATEVVRTGNVLLAAELETDDDVMDTLHRDVFEALMAPDWPHDVTTAVDMTLLARFYERYADNAVGVAQRMIHAVVGGGGGLPPRPPRRLG